MNKHFLDVVSSDIVIRRKWDPHADIGGFSHTNGEVAVNVPRTVVFHCEDGFSFGTAEPGVYDLALNILQTFLPGREVEGKLGTRGSRAAFLLHLKFAADFLRGAKGDNLVLACGDIKAWIRNEIRMTPPHLRSTVIGIINGYTEAMDVTTEGAGALKSAFVVDKGTGKVVTFGDAEGVFIALHSAEDDMPFVHKDFQALLGKRLKITIEEVVDEYLG